MKKLVIGILAHVDAGKTTLSESMLYLSGKIGKLGRVDNKDAYLDNYELERARGITIFSKQALLDIGDIRITLLDTPGHADFAAEMERTLQVLDYAILVISGADGVQGHTKTLWRLLDMYQIPVFIFVNKMDRDGTDSEKLLKQLKMQLDDGCIEFGQDMTVEQYDQLAMCDETLMQAYLETGQIETQQIKTALIERKVFPCYFGSALRLEGIEQFMQGIHKYAQLPCYGDEFGAKIFKITRDELGNRLTHMKLTGGRLKVRDVLKSGLWEEKVNQIRIYSGQKYDAVSGLEAGSICQITGLTQTRPGEGLGIEEASGRPVLEPVLSYRMLIPKECDPRVMLPKLRQIEEEEPELHIVWDEPLQEIQVQIMGEVQIEILQSLIHSRFGVEVSFDTGKIVYKETIADTIEGVGHFEPLRHYAEVHLVLQPGEPGTGLQFATACSEEMLSKNWQKLILTHLEEKEHKGVLTGSPITDMKITLVAGRAHNKHTQGGDFREATYRAVRQGLMQAQSIVLEPYYAFELELPVKMVGRAMADIEQMYGTCEISQTNDEIAVLVGSAPVVTTRNYHKEVIAYTKGVGRLFCNLKGYEACHNAQEVIDTILYDSQTDFDNPTGSVFCAHGAGFLVNWDQVKDYMHVESYLQKKSDPLQTILPNHSGSTQRWIDLDEIDQILNNTFYANQGKKSIWKRNKSTAHSFTEPVVYGNAPKEVKEKFLLVDGYNIIYAWPELQEHAKDNMDAARMKLLEALSNYQGICKCQIIVVFDAYRVEGHIEEEMDYHNIHMVFTRQAQTADQYIEKFAHDNQKKYDITVATSDGLQQIIIRGSGAGLLSARELKAQMQEANERVQQEYQLKQEKYRNDLLDTLSQDQKQQIQELMNQSENSEEVKDN